MTEINIDPEKIDEILTRAVEEVLPTKEGLKERLMSNEPLRIYNGIDPTSPSIHLGNAIILRKMQKFVELGHHVIFLIGTFTGLVGDPSDKSSTRQMLSPEQIEENIKEYKSIAGKILDFDKVEIVYNGNWLSDMNLAQWMRILSKITHQQVIERDLFQRRLKEGREIWMHELMYPMLQGYDSVELDVDLELGGTDQTFNMLMGRKLQKVFGKREKFVLTVPLIPGTDGQKMSKSIGNTVDLDDAPADMYGKLMSLTDEVIPQYFECCTDVEMARVEEIKRSIENRETNPMELKKELARQIVKMYHGGDEARKAEVEFENVVQGGEVPDDISDITVSESPLSLLSLASIACPNQSNSELKRLSQQGGIEVDGEKHTDPSEEIVLKDGMILRVGKRKYYKLRT